MTSRSASNGAQVTAGQGQATTRQRPGSWTPATTTGTSQGQAATAAVRLSASAACCETHEQSQSISLECKGAVHAATHKVSTRRHLQMTTRNTTLQKALRLMQSQQTKAKGCAVAPSARDAKRLPGSVGCTLSFLLGPGLGLLSSATTSDGATRRIQHHQNVAVERRRWHHSEQPSWQSPCPTQSDAAEEAGVLVNHFGALRQKVCCK